MERPHGRFCQMRCLLHCISSLCSLLNLSFIGSKWRVISLNMDSVIAHNSLGRLQSYVDPLLKREILLEKPSIWGLTLEQPIAFAFSSACTSHMVVPEVALSKWDNCWEGTEMQSVFGRAWEFHPACRHLLLSHSLSLTILGCTLFSLLGPLLVLGLLMVNSSNCGLISTDKKNILLHQSSDK